MSVAIRFYKLLFTILAFAVPISLIAYVIFTIATSLFMFDFRTGVYIIVVYAMLCVMAGVVILADIVFEEEEY